jgi:hypothetical protein
MKMPQLLQACRLVKRIWLMANFLATVVSLGTEVVKSDVTAAVSPVASMGCIDSVA